MKKSQIPKKIFFQAALSAVALVLSLVLYFSSTTSVAWFSNNKQVAATGASVSVEYDDMEVEFHVYKCLSGATTATDRDEDGTLFTVSDFDFLQYDIIFGEMNKYTPVLLYMRVTGSDVPEDGGTITITLNRADLLPVVDESGAVTGTVARETVDAKGKLSDYNSSVIRYYAAIDKSLYGTDIAAMYDDVKLASGYDPSLAGASTTPWINACFTACENPEEEEVSDRTYTHEPTITLSATYQASDFRDGGLDLYLLMVYDTALSQDYSGGIQNFGASIEEGNDKVLLNDLAEIKLAHS